MKESTRGTADVARPVIAQDMRPPAWACPWRVPSRDHSTTLGVELFQLEAVSTEDQVRCLRLGRIGRPTAC